MWWSMSNCPIWYWSKKTESLFINKGGAKIDTILIGLTNTRHVDFNDVLVFFLLYPSKVQEIEGGSNHFFHFWTLSTDVTPFANKRWIYGKVFKYCRRQILTVGGLLKSNYNSRQQCILTIPAHTYILKLLHYYQCILTIPAYTYILQLLHYYSV